MLIRRSLAVLLLLLPPAAQAGPAPGAGLTAVLSQMTGAVQAVGPGVRSLPRAQPWQVLQAGAKIHVPAGGSAGIACSNLRFVRLRGPATWSLTEQACARGEELTPAEYALVAPQGGRFKVVDGLFVLERGVRSGDGDDPLAPVVLRPRNTVLRSPRPEIVWSMIPGTTEYELRWRGRGTSGQDARLRAGDVACAQERDGMAVCSLPWPEERPDLPPGEVFFLRIAARSGIGEPWHANDPVEMRTQEIKDSLALERELRDLERLGLAGAALDAARAGLLAERGLYADAAELYHRALAAEPTAEVKITLADLDVAMGLHALAEPRYREELANGTPATRAAAAFGLGRVHYARANYREALASFRQAHDLYSQLGLEEDAAAARQAADRTAARIQG